MIKIVIAGSRDYQNYSEAKQFIKECLKKANLKENPVFLSGGCRGADRLGEQFAADFGFEIRVYPAQWEKYGKAAGPIRNKLLAEECDVLISFWDGKSRGTKSMIDLARKNGKIVWIRPI